MRGWMKALQNALHSRHADVSCNCRSVSSVAPDSSSARAHVTFRGGLLCGGCWGTAGAGARQCCAGERGHPVPRGKRGRVVTVRPCLTLPCPIDNAGRRAEQRGRVRPVGGGGRDPARHPPDLHHARRARRRVHRQVLLPGALPGAPRVLTGPPATHGRWRSLVACQALISRQVISVPSGAPPRALVAHRVISCRSLLQRVDTHRNASMCALNLNLT